MMPDKTLAKSSLAPQWRKREGVRRSDAGKAESGLTTEYRGGRSQDC
jgi:hypothetical protein